ncbi:hypothetical protein ACWDSL_14800 [Streptomyces sp. NPDC000941]
MEKQFRSGDVCDVGISIECERLLGHGCALVSRAVARPKTSGVTERVAACGPLSAYHHPKRTATASRLQQNVIMNLEGVGAIAAAAVAAVGIPSALIVGRWQMRAALRTAEETGRAGLAQAESNYRSGLAQAESTYSAALDAVRAEATNAQMQWRRGVQREAFVSYLLAARHVTEIAKKMNHTYVYDEVPISETTSLRTELSDARIALRSASLIVSLEAPTSLRTTADRISYWVGELADALEEEIVLFEAEKALTCLCEIEARQGSSDRPASELRAALDELGRQVRAHAQGSDPRDLGRDNMPPEIVMAWDSVQQAFQEHGSRTPLSLVERVALEDFQCHGLGEQIQKAQEAEEELKAWEEQFLPEARTVLDETPRA